MSVEGGAVRRHHLHVGEATIAELGDGARLLGEAAHKLDRCGGGRVSGSAGTEREMAARAQLGLGQRAIPKAEDGVATSVSYEKAPPPHLWPPGIKRWVEKCFAGCRTSLERAAMQKQVKACVEAASKGEFHTKDWEREPLPKRDTSHDRKRERLYGETPTFLEKERADEERSDKERGDDKERERYRRARARTHRTPTLRPSRSTQRAHLRTPKHGGRSRMDGGMAGRRLFNTTRKIWNPQTRKYTYGPPPSTSEGVITS